MYRWSFFVTIILLVPATLIDARAPLVSFTSDKCMLKKCIELRYNQRDYNPPRTNEIENIIGPDLSDRVAEKFKGQKNVHEEKIKSDIPIIIDEMLADRYTLSSVVSALQNRIFRDELEQIIINILLETCNGVIDYK